MNHLFANTESPFILYYKNEKWNLSNFNFKNCDKIFNIKTFENYFLFIKNNQIILGSIQNSLTKNIISKPLNKQIYNLSYLKNYNLIAFISDENHDQKTLQDPKYPSAAISCKLNIIDKNLNEVSSFSFERAKEVCHTFEILDLYNNNKQHYNDNYGTSSAFENISNEATDALIKAVEDPHSNSANKNTNCYAHKNNNNNCGNFNYTSDQDKQSFTPVIFILGTSIFEKNQEPRSGHIIILEFNKSLRFTKLFELELYYPIYKISCLRDYIIAAIPGSLAAFKFSINNKNTKETIDFTGSNCNTPLINSYSDVKSLAETFYFEVKEIRKCNEFNIIYDFLCHKDFILVSDVNKSVSLYKLDKDKENITELCKDFNPLFCISINKTSHNIYTICDINNNLYKIRKEVIPKEDKEKHK